VRFWQNAVCRRLDGKGCERFAQTDREPKGGSPKGLGPGKGQPRDATLAGSFRAEGGCPWGKPAVGYRSMQT